MIIFSDLINEFQILDYSPTHSQLLIRSMRKKDREYNIDIILKGVFAILIPTTLKGLEISVLEDSKKKDFLIEEYNFKQTKNDYRIFCIKDSNNINYFINAMCFGVYHNKLDILETSIGRYYMGDLNENILWYAE